MITMAVTPRVTGAAKVTAKVSAWVTLGGENSRIVAGFASIRLMNPTSRRGSAEKHARVSTLSSRIGISA
jgi:hypothetical protein